MTAKEKLKRRQRIQTRFEAQKKSSVDAETWVSTGRSHHLASSAMTEARQERNLGSEVRVIERQRFYPFTILRVLEVPDA